MASGIPVEGALVWLDSWEVPGVNVGEVQDLSALVADALRCPPGTAGGGQFTGPDQTNCDTGQATTDAADLSEQDRVDIGSIAVRTAAAGILGAAGAAALYAVWQWMGAGDSDERSRQIGGSTSTARQNLETAIAEEIERLNRGEGTRRELRSTVRTPAGSRRSFSGWPSRGRGGGGG